MKIDLVCGYFIEREELNTVLKLEYEPKDKDGNVKKGEVAEKVIGYFAPSNDGLKKCVERVISILNLSENDVARISMLDYVERVEKACAKLYAQIKE